MVGGESIEWNLALSAQRTRRRRKMQIPRYARDNTYQVPDDTRKLRDGTLEDFFLVAEIAEGADVGDDEGDAELVFCADLAEGDAAVFDGEAAAVAVVADLDELVLQGLVGEIVADAGGEVEAGAGFAAIADEGAHLVGKRLKDGIGLQTEVRDGGEEFAVGLDLQQRSYSGDVVELGIVFEDLLGVVEAARRDFEIADDGGPIDGAEGEGKRSDGVQGLKDVAGAGIGSARERAVVAGNEGAAEGGIEIVFLDDAPGEELLRLVIAFFEEEALGDAVFDFVGVGEGRAGVKANEIGEIMDAGDVAVGYVRLDGVLVAATSFVFVKRGAVEEALKGGGTNFDGEFAGIASDGLTADVAGGVEGIAVISGAESGGSGDGEPGAEVKGEGNAGSEFGARDVVRSVDVGVVAVGGADGSVEGEIDGELLPGGPLDGTEAGFGNVANGNGDGRSGAGGESQKSFVVERGNIEAEALEIVGEEDGTADFGVDGVAEGVGEGQTEGERGELVVVGDKAPAVGQKRLHFELLLMAALLYGRAGGLGEAAVDDTEVGVLDGGVLERAGADFAALGGAPAAEELGAESGVKPGLGGPVESIAENETF